LSSLSKVDTETEESDFVADINRRVQRTSLESLRDIVSHVKITPAAETKDSVSTTQIMIFVLSWRVWLLADSLFYKECLARQIKFAAYFLRSNFWL
jgi:hypothetical protein